MERYIVITQSDYKMYRDFVAYGKQVIKGFDYYEEYHYFNNKDIALDAYRDSVSTKTPEQFSYILVI